jgi:hypothetical protein
VSVVLVWKPADPEAPELGPARVAERLGALFAPLFEEPPPARTLAAGGAHVARLDLPLRGFSPASCEEGRDRWALAIDFPLGALALATPPGADAAEGPLLRAARALEADPLATLERLAPPFSLLWSGPNGDTLSLQNDALGMAQLFEVETPRLWAATNRLAALAALGVPLEPVPEEWALWATFDWFPLAASGFRGVRHLAPATRIVVTRGGFARARHDALARWVVPAPLDRASALESARAAMRGQLAAVLPLLERPDVTLTGGWDSRAVVALLRGLGVAPELSVRGSPERPDVAVATELARIARLPLRVRTESGLPAGAPEGLRRSLALALRWQAGQCSPHRATTFLAGGGALRARRPSVTGQHGELARRLRALFDDGDLDEREAERWSTPELERRARRVWVDAIPAALRPPLRAAVERRIDEAFAAADRYGLDGCARLDFFFLNEVTRRKGGALNAWQTRLVVAPFLAPGALRALFAVPGGLAPGELHRYLLERDAPDWRDVPFARPAAAAPSDPSQPGAWRRPWGRENYDRPAYWAAVGRPLFDEALARGGFCAELFDPDEARRRFPHGAELVVLLHLLSRELDSLATRGG